jgi:hypothetical protein
MAWALPTSARCGRCSSTRARQSRTSRTETDRSLADDARAEVESQGIPKDQHPGRDPRPSKIRRLPSGACGALRIGRKSAPPSRPRISLASASSRPTAISCSTCWRLRPSAPPMRAPPPPRLWGTATPVAHVDMHGSGKARETPIYAREDLPRSTEIAGPAIVSEATGTTMIEPGWAGRIDALGNLILERVEAAGVKQPWAPKPIRSCSRCSTTSS